MRSLNVAPATTQPHKVDQFQASLDELMQYNPLYPSFSYRIRERASRAVHESLPARAAPVGRGRAHAPRRRLLHAQEGRRRHGQTNTTTTNIQAQRALK